MILEMIISALISMGVESQAQKIKRGEHVIRILKGVGYDPNDPPKEFDDIYNFALVEFGVYKPAPILKLLKDKRIRNAIKYGFTINDYSSVKELAEEIQVRKTSPALDIDVNLMLENFIVVFKDIALRSRIPSEVMRDDLLKDLHNRHEVFQGQMNELLLTTKKNAASFEFLWESFQNLAQTFLPEIDEASLAEINDVSQIDLPDGWELINKGFLKTKRQSLPLNHKQVIAYFNGRLPNWFDALSEDKTVPKREVVFKTVAKILEDISSENLGITLIRGAGGEGKTTVLLQIICELVENHDCKVIWRSPNSNNHFDRTTLLTMIKQKEVWLIAADHAEDLAKEIAQYTAELTDLGCTNIHFLLSSRNADWIAHRGNLMNWNGEFHDVLLAGISKPDATKVVSAWHNYGEDGLGSLYEKFGDNVENAAQELCNRSNLGMGSENGTFLGAMLSVRKEGDKLKAHVRDLILRLDERPVNFRSRSSSKLKLSQAFAYIVAPHAYQKEILSKIVLAELFNCSIDEIMPEIVGPLGDEAVVTSTSEYILTRHPAIAEVAYEILKKDLFLDFNEIFVQLVKVARESFYKYRSIRLEPVPAIEKWTYLSSDLYDLGEKRLGISLAYAVLGVDPEHFHGRAKLGQLLRKAESFSESVKVFRECPKRVPMSNRKYFYEWGMSEGSIKNYAIKVWLSAFALADLSHNDQDSEYRDFDEIRNTEVCLTGMCEGLFDLSESEIATRDQEVFFKAGLSTAVLGLELPYLTDLGRNVFRKYLESGIQNDVILQNASVAYQTFLNSLELIWQYREEKNFPSWVKPLNQLKFSELKAILKLP